MTGTLVIRRSAETGALRAVLYLRRGDGDPLEIQITGTPTATPGEYAVQVDPLASVEAVL